MSEGKEKKYSVKIKNLGDSQIEIEGEILAEEFDGGYAAALKRLGESVELPGFRRGHVPEAVLKEKVGEAAILHEMAEMAIAKAYPVIVGENDVDVIGRPEIIITKVARGNPLGFKIKTAVMPRVILPDYKKIAGNVAPVLLLDTQVSPKEVDDVVKEIVKHHGDSEPKESKGEETQSEELTDEFVKKLGKFETVSEFKKKIEENLGEEKKMRAKEKRRLEIIDAILKEMKLVIPRILVESELQKMSAEFKGNIAGMGLKPEEYFQKLGKSEAELKKEWEGDAEKRVKIYLLLQAIAESEHVVIPDEEIEKETTRVLEYHKDVPRDRARNYVHGLLLNDRVIKLLEEVGDSGKM